MMDKKLARGHMKAGLRNNQKRGPGQLGPFVRAWLTNHRRWAAGKAMRVGISDATLRREWKESVDRLYFSKLHFPRRMHRVSAVSGSLDAGTAKFHGRAESVLSYIKTVTVASPRKTEGRSLWGKVLIHNHAIVRFMERTNKDFGSLAAELGQTIALSTLFEEACQWTSRPVVFPLASGLLLGECVPAEGTPFSGTHIQVDKWGRPQIRSQHLERTTACALITFISHDQMTDGQAAIWKALLDIIKGYGEAILAHHIGDLSADGGRLRRYRRHDHKADLMKAREAFSRLIASVTWRKSVRSPAGRAGYPGWKMIDHFAHHIPEGASRIAVLSGLNGHRWRIEKGFLSIMDMVEFQQPELVGDLSDAIMSKAAPGRKSARLLSAESQGWDRFFTGAAG